MKEISVKLDYSVFIDDLDKASYVLKHGFKRSSEMQIKALFRMRELISGNFDKAYDFKIGREEKAYKFKIIAKEVE